MMKKANGLALLFVFSFSLAYAQPTGEKAQLENERQQIQKELLEIQQLYNQVKGQTKQTLAQLNMLNRKINLQEQYINSISKELRTIDDDIYLSNIEIYRLQNQLDTLKKQYARSVVHAYKNRSNYNYLNFIFSASSFNDAIRRVAYLKSYRALRERQVTSIKEMQQLIARRKEQQVLRKEQKNLALQNQTRQVQELAVQKKEKDQVVSQLKSKEKDLQKQINAKKKRDRDLQNAIVAIVKREIKAAEEAAKAKAKAEADARAKADAANAGKTTTPAANPTAPLTPATTSTTRRNEPASKPASYLDLNARDVALNSSFVANRAKLPWPVDNGVLTLRFGPNKIENTLLTFDNPGLTIATPAAGAPVKAVFDGEVSGVYNIGDGMVVTIRHGKYFTTYSNLSSVSVAKGAQVKTGQVIGKTGRDDEGTGGQLDFILMVEAKNVDPLPWLRR